MNALGVLVRPRSTLGAIAAAPRLTAGFAVVVVSGLVSAGISAAAGALTQGGLSSLVTSLLLPALFVAYWLVEAWLVDAGASMLGRSGHRRTFLAVSGFVFVPWIAYALLTLVEAAAQHSGGSGSGVAAGLAWLTLPVLCAERPGAGAAAIRDHRRRGAPGDRGADRGPRILRRAPGGTCGGPIAQEGPSTCPRRPLN
ncbi:MAG: hypothetical protein E6I33_02960 [Chloroflexi bacterium]|nr:MAG: hypothetical protein E6I33_02960 [Chloroflexota bacterium]